jgi:UDP-glucose 4-epimerase
MVVALRYLVTGAAGFIGYALADRLASRGDVEVVCVDCFVRGEADAAYEALGARPNVTRIDCDLTDPAAVEALPDVDVIFHMAALNGTQNFYERPFEVVRHCTLPTLNLLSRYAGSPVQRFVYAGTSEAYASTVTRFGWPVPTAEDVPLSFDDPSNVRWSYGASKMHGEVAVFAAAAQTGLKHSVIRYHNAYGPRMGDKHVVPDFLIRGRKGEYVLYGWEDTRAFIYIDDAVTATIAIAETPACEGEIVNIGAVRETRIDELGRLMMDAAGWTGEIALQPSPKGSVKRRAPDTSKLTRLTGFQETWTLEDGLKVTADYYLSQP